MKWIIIIGIFITGLLTALGFMLNELWQPANLVNMPPYSNSTSNPLPNDQQVVSVATNLYVPWSLDFLPTGDLLVTERSGRVLLISNNETTEILKIEEVVEKGEGGLMGLAVDPEFAQTARVYFYYTYEANNNQTANRIVSYQLVNQQLTNRQLILDQIPGALFHNGGRIKFGPDGFLYVATGDAQAPSTAQDLKSLSGKILRITADGKAAPGNPFNTLVWSYGHRNPQGLVWDDQGQLWSTEHGPSGIGTDCCRDELNLIESGKNYGWPLIKGNQKQDNLMTPQLDSGSIQTWAPGGMVYYQGSIYFAGLKGQAIYKYQIESKQFTTLFQNQWGRIRDLIIGPDQYLYFTTSNKDGRGKPSKEDDQIIKIPLNNI